MFGQGSFNITNNPNPATAPAPPFAPTSADNGLSVDAVTGRIVLGQDVGAAGDPGQLLSNREIPLKGFSFTIGETGSSHLIILPATRNYLFGDINATGNGTTFSITDVSRSSRITSAGSIYFDLNAGAGLFRYGDISGTVNGSTLSIDDANTDIRFTMSGGRKLQIQESPGNDIYIFGDADLLRSGLQLQMISSGGGGNRALITSSVGDMLDLDQSSATYVMGDVGSSFNSTRLTVNDSGGVREVRAEGANPFAVQGSTTLIRSYTTLSNAAAAAVATLNNAPVAGDPTKWISINDNGTVRRIPCW